jgi:NAD(P)-dependent dehydrogenase (short-subunit alcohol dehydrogenase family)
LEGKVAVITGGASGMGRAAALTFLREGARVVIADLNNAKAEETLGFAGQDGHADAIRYLRTDVSKEADIVALIDTAVDTFGRLDCVFNNAGVGGAMGPITQTSVGDFDRTFAILMRSVFLGIKHGALAMRKGGWAGSIISTSSTSGLNGGSGPAAYSAAKAGVENITRNAAVELAPDRIRVNVIAPGGIRTSLIPAKDDAEMKSFMKGRQPWPDVGLPQDIANAALFLASDDSRFCTGTTILVDGGLMAWGPGLFPHANASKLAGFSTGSTGEA